MSTQLKEMGAWFFLRTREWGIGRVGKFELGRAPLWGKRFLNFLGKKTPKMTTFSSCINVSPSLMIWIEQNVFGNPIGNSHSNKQAEHFWVWTFHEFIPSSDLNPSRFIFSSMDCSLSCFLHSTSHFPKHECPESDFVSLIWKTSNVFVLVLWSSRSGTDNVQKFVNFCVCM